MAMVLPLLRQDSRRLIALARRSPCLWTARAFSSAGTSLDFRDSRIAFQSKSTLDLFRAWWVFKVCQLGIVVRNCDALYSWSVRILGARLTHGVLRYTFFNHFCAGETVGDIIPKMAALRQYGVGGILDYAAEAKEDQIPKALPVPPEPQSSVVGAPESARHYDYVSEAMCDANAEVFLDAIRSVRDATPDGFAAIKLSGLGDPVLLERMSTCLVEMVRLFRRISCGLEGDAESREPFLCIDRSFRLDYASFSEGWGRLFKAQNDEDLRRMFDDMDTDRDGLITFLEWSKEIRLSEINNLVRGCRDQGPLSRKALNEEELKLYRNMINRVLRILDLAQELGVRVMIDAEWTDIQPALDHIVIFLQRIYNKGDRPIVFNTYQTYLKGMHGRVLRDLQRSKQEGWRFGAKVVRGAYMVSEREKARKRGVDSPICDSYTETEANCHRVIDAILEHSAAAAASSAAVEGPRQHPAAEVLIASHNRGTIEHTLRRMEELKVEPSHVYFGQLLGMADNLTFTLGTAGYKVYKYVPYGPIGEVMPYLIRRTQENSAILGSPGVQEERQMVGEELWRRISRR